ncbi:MAG: PIG-L family deacetylase, partial [Ferruginibacter sp.]|nr:PIG-L family deacetylase [Chitinophagaceae bacterium]
SKTPEETFTKWDKEKILSDVVWVIRKFQPDIIINRFPLTDEGGHGHHTASGILANEAFAAAADPGRFPEQLQYVPVWQAKRVVWNTFNFGGNNTTREDQYKVDVGGYNPLLGKSYGEIAAESRSQHKSQGFGVPAGRGEAWEYFKATKGDQPVNDLMDGVELTWKRIAGGEGIAKMVDDLSASFDFLHPERSVKGLVQLYMALKNLPTGYWQNKKLEEIKQLVQQCSGLFVDATTAEQFAIVTDSIRVNFSFNNRLGVNAVLKKVTISTAGSVDSSLNQPLVKNRNLNYSKTFFIPSKTLITQPYWLQNKMEEGYYNISDKTVIGRPDVELSIVLSVDMNIEGTDLQFTKPVKYKFTDPVKGELYQPLVVVPYAVVSVNPSTVILTDDNKPGFSVTVKALKMFSQEGRELSAVDIKKQDPPVELKSIPKMEKSQELTYDFSVKETIKSERTNFYVNSRNNPLVVNGNIKSIKYDHIPFISYVEEATLLVKKIHLEKYGKKIGYITGAGDKVPEALEQMGYEVVLLSGKELSKNNLDQFDAIITGVRAYNTHDWMNKHHEKLMKYVHEGGNLIVQYNTSNQIGPVRAKIGPYNFNITRTRVTDENAAVTLLKPEHPVFNFPNKITTDDFKGWVQERSIYHASDTSGKFEKLIAMNDPGEKSDDGSLIVTKYGKGWFTYTGIVFFRELPAGVPGAYRLLANIIALNRKKAF